MSKHLCFQFLQFWQKSNFCLEYSLSVVNPQIVAELRIITGKDRSAKICEKSANIFPREVKPLNAWW